MFSFLVFTVLFFGCRSFPVFLHYSFSPAVGGGSGDSYSTGGNGRITAVRIWNFPNSYITGIQVSYNGIWDEVIGRAVYEPHEMMLFGNEVITQVSGKYDRSYIYQLIFQTSRGRSLIVGQPRQTSFNLYATHADAELVLLSGAQNRYGITAVAAHWGKYYEDQSNSTDIAL